MSIGGAPNQSRATSTWRRVGGQARFETATLLRNGEQLLVSLILPALALLALYFTRVPDLGPARRIDVVVPGALALAVISTAFTGQAIQTGFDRRYGVLRLLGTTPLGRGGLLLAKVGAAAIVVLLQTVFLGVLGLLLGWQPHWAAVPVALVSLTLGAVTCVGLAMVVAGRLRAEAVLALANLLWVLFLGLGAVVVPPAVMPLGLGRIATWLPPGALGEALRAPLVQGAIPWLPWLTLLLWGVGLAAIARATFRWSD